MVKIFLVNPPQSSKYYSQPPMGLALIAAVLRDNGYTVNVIDANALRLTPENICDYINDADLVGLTAMTPTIGIAARVATHLKKHNPRLVIVLGGPHGTLLPEETLGSIPEMDIVVRGEGERTIIDLLKYIEQKKSLDDINGITFRKEEKIVSTPVRDETVDLDSLPYLAYDLLPWNTYRPHPPHGRAMPFAAIITSRGCPYRCSYCSKPVFGYRFRTQSPDRVIEEIRNCQRVFGAKEVAFYDDVFTFDKDRAHSIVDGILKNDLKISWTCETRVNLVDKELLLHMRRAGCYAIAYGIESASQDILNVLNKGITAEQVKKAVQMTHEAGIQTIGYFMLGAPGESEETIKKTIEFAKELKLDFAQFSITIPFPGTKLYDIYVQQNSRELNWDDFVYYGRNTNNGFFESNSLKAPDLQRWIKRANKQFYLRVGYVAQRIRRTSSVSDLKVNLEGLKMLLRN